MPQTPAFVDGGLAASAESRYRSRAFSIKAQASTIHRMLAINVEPLNAARIRLRPQDSADLVLYASLENATRLSDFSLMAVGAEPTIEIGRRSRQPTPLLQAAHTTITPTIEIGRCDGAAAALEGVWLAVRSQEWSGSAEYTVGAPWHSI